MNEVARRYWNEILDLHAPAPGDARRARRRARQLKLRKIRPALRDPRR